MQYRNRRSNLSCALEMLSLDPLPYKALLFLFAIIFLLVTSMHSFEAEGPEYRMTFQWVLPTTPITMLFIIQCLSSFKGLFGKQMMTKPYLSFERVSPWFVAVLIVQLLVMAQYQPSIHQRWPVRF